MYTLLNFTDKIKVSVKLEAFQTGVHNPYEEYESSANHQENVFDWGRTTLAASVLPPVCLAGEVTQFPHQ